MLISPPCFGVRKVRGLDYARAGPHIGSDPPPHLIMPETIVASPERWHICPERLGDIFLSIIRNHADDPHEHLTALPPLFTGR